MRDFDDIMAEAEAESGCEPGELAGTFPPGFAQSIGHTNEPFEDRTTIGDVIVHEGRPENNNPYRGNGLSGPPRQAALQAFRDDKDTHGLTFWHAPAGGGAYEITNPDDIDWRGMRG